MRPASGTSVLLHWLAGSMFQYLLLVLLQALGTMLIYPNSMSFDVMEGGGVPPPPQGMLLIRVLRGSGLKGKELTSKIDPFVEVSVLYPSCIFICTLVFS